MLVAAKPPQPQWTLVRHILPGDVILHLDSIDGLHSGMTLTAVDSIALHMELFYIESVHTDAGGFITTKRITRTHYAWPAGTRLASADVVGVGPDGIQFKHSNRPKQDYRNYYGPASTNVYEGGHDRFAIHDEIVERSQAMNKAVTEMINKRFKEAFTILDISDTTTLKPTKHKSIKPKKKK